MLQWLSSGREREGNQHWLPESTLHTTQGCQNRTERGEGVTEVVSSFVWLPGERAPWIADTRQLQGAHSHLAFLKVVHAPVIHKV